MRETSGSSRQPLNPGRPRVRKRPFSNSQTVPHTQTCSRTTPNDLHNSEGIAAASRTEKGKGRAVPEVPELDNTEAAVRRYLNQEEVDSADEAEDARVAGMEIEAGERFTPSDQRRESLLISDRLF